MAKVQIRQSSADSKIIQLGQVKNFVPQQESVLAKDICPNVLNEKPYSWDSHMLLAEIAFKQKDPNVIQKLIAHALENSAPTKFILTLSAYQVELTNDSRALIETLTAIIEKNSRSAFAYDKLIRAFAKVGDYSSAMSAANKFLSIHPNKTLPQRFFDEISTEVRDKDYAQWLNTLIKSAPENSGIYPQRALYFLQEGKFNAALNDIEKTLELDPLLELPSKIRYALMQLIEDVPKSHDRLEKFFKCYPKNISLFRIWTTILYETGRVAEFRKLVEENWDWIKDKKPIHAALFYMQTTKGVDTEDAKLRGRRLYDSYLMDNRLVEAIDCAETKMQKALPEQALAIMPTRYPAMKIADYTTESLIIGRERPNGVVLTFSGLTDKVAVPAHVLDIFFAELGLTPIYLQDYTRCIYLQGIKHYGASFAETLTAIRTEIEGLGADKPLFTFGNSAGGLAAMIYGAKLGAKASVVFSPITSVSPSDLKAMGEQRAAIVRRHCMKNIDHREVNLHQTLTEHKGQYKIHAYVGADCLPDQPHADLLATLPKTDVHYMEDVDLHTAFFPAVEKYGLLNLLRDHFSL